MKYSSLLAALTFFTLTLGWADGLHCWECNSRQDPNCGHPFRTHTVSLTDCSQRFVTQNMSLGATICRKITQKVGGEVRIIRSCGFFHPEDAGTCISRAGTHLVFMHYCQCKGDACNHGTTPLPPPSCTFMLMLLLFTFFS